MALVRSGKPKGIQPKDALAGLAELWDQNEDVRHGCIQRKALLQWQDPKKAGMINHETLHLNVLLMKTVVDTWCPTTDEMRTVPIDEMKLQARWPNKENKNSKCFLFKFNSCQLTVGH